MKWDANFATGITTYTFCEDKSPVFNVKSVSPGQVWKRFNHIKSTVRAYHYNVVKANSKYVSGYFIRDNGFVQAFNIKTENFLTNLNRIA